MHIMQERYTHPGHSHFVQNVTFSGLYTFNVADGCGHGCVPLLPLAVVVAAARPLFAAAAISRCCFRVRINPKGRSSQLHAIVPHIHRAAHERLVGALRRIFFPPLKRCPGCSCMPRPLLRPPRLGV